MNIINVKIKLSDDELKAIKGKFINESYIKYPLINKNTTVYNEHGEIVLVFLKNVVPFKFAKEAYPFLRKSAQKTKNRGQSSGDLSDYKVGDKLDGMTIGKKQGNRYYPLKRDGTLSNSLEAKGVQSGVIGYMDRYARIPYCRATAITSKYFNEYKKTLPYIRYISSMFEKYVPEKFKNQKEFWEKINKDFKIDNTAFTTVTVNKNFRTACHCDAGDYQKGFGNLAVIESGEYTGAYTVIPKYGIAVDVRNCDVCFFDVHELHGNTELKTKGMAERISVVCYTRHKMIKCGSAEEELEIALERE
jgi:hypothetical protein|tara:strand:+ start:1737 stop:2648 length:912 start_codon:yes stop_codon:yes gene_type:complete